MRSTSFHPNPHSATSFDPAASPLPTKPRHISTIQSWHCKYLRTCLAWQMSPQRSQTYRCSCTRASRVKTPKSRAYFYACYEALLKMCRITHINQRTLLLLLYILLTRQVFLLRLIKCGLSAQYCNELYTWITNSWEIKNRLLSNA